MDCSQFELDQAFDSCSEKLYRMKLMQRLDGRLAHEIRKIEIQKTPQKHPAGSVLIHWGDTHVLCSAQIEEKLPHWLLNENKGWITAEYNMLPGSSDKRISREKSRSNGRTHEIQRLIGRSLRSCIALEELGQRSIMIDCDVIQADGGTRVASITGAYLALRLALCRLLELKKIQRIPKTTKIAGISIGRCHGKMLADLNYQEDSAAELDANIIMNDRGEFVEIQGTAEKGSFSKGEFQDLLSLAEKSCSAIFEIQQEYLKLWKLD